MAATGSPSFAAYFAHLRTDMRDEVQQFVNTFTVNETYFYREELSVAMPDERPAAGTSARQTRR